VRKHHRLCERSEAIHHETSTNTAIDHANHVFASEAKQSIMKPNKQNALATVLFVIYLLVLTGIVLFKLPFRFEFSDGIRAINLIPFQGSFAENGVLLLRDFFYNILVFIPLGVYISMLKGDWPFVKKALPAIALSFAFEALQFIFAIGRSDVTDLIGNTLGGVIGIGFYALLFRIFKNSCRINMIVNVFALALTVCAVSRFAYLFYLSHFVMGQL